MFIYYQKLSFFDITKKIKNKIFFIFFIFLSLFFFSCNQEKDQNKWNNIVKEYLNFSKENSLTLLKNQKIKKNFFSSLIYQSNKNYYENKLLDNPRNENYKKKILDYEKKLKKNLNYNDFKRNFLSYVDKKNQIEVFEFKCIEKFNNNNKNTINEWIKELINSLPKSNDYMKKNFYSFLNINFIRNLIFLKNKNYYNKILKLLEKKNITLTYSIIFEKKNNKRIPTLKENFYFNDYKKYNFFVFNLDYTMNEFIVFDKYILTWNFCHIFFQNLFNKKKQKFLNYIKYFEKVFVEYEEEYNKNLNYYNQTKKEINDYQKEIILLNKWLVKLKTPKIYKKKFLLITKLKTIISKIEKILNYSIKKIEKKITKLTNEIEENYKKKDITFEKLLKEYRKKQKEIERLNKQLKSIKEHQKQKKKIFKKIISLLKTLIEKIENKEKKILDFLNQNANTWLPTNNIKFERSRKSKSLIYDRSGSIWIEKTTEIYKQRITFSYNGFYFKAEKEKTDYKTPRNKTLTTERIVLLSIYSYINKKRIELKNINIGRVFLKDVNGKKEFIIILTQEFIDTYLSDGGYQTWKEKEQSFKEQEEDKYQKIRIKLQNMIFDYENILKQEQLDCKKVKARLLERFNFKFGFLYNSFKEWKEKFKKIKNNEIKLLLYNYLKYKNGWTINEINKHSRKRNNFTFSKDILNNKLKVYWKNKYFTLLRDYKVVKIKKTEYIINIVEKLPNNIIDILKNKITLKNGYSLSSISILKFKLSNDNFNLMIELEGFVSTKKKVSDFSIVENRLVDHSKPLPQNIIQIIKKKLQNFNGKKLNFIKNIFKNFEIILSNNKLKVQLLGFNATKILLNDYSIIENRLVNHLESLTDEYINNILKKFLNNGITIKKLNKLTKNFIFSKDILNNLKVKLKSYEKTLTTVKNYKVIVYNTNKFLVDTKKKLTGEVLNFAFSKLEEKIDSTIKFTGDNFIVDDFSFTIDKKRKVTKVKLKNYEKTNKDIVPIFKIETITNKLIKIKNLKVVGKILILAKSELSTWNGKKVSWANKIITENFEFIIESNKITKVKVKCFSAERSFTIEEQNQYTFIGSGANAILVKTDSPLTGEALKLASSELESLNGEKIIITENKFSTTNFEFIINRKKITKVKVIGGEANSETLFKPEDQNKYTFIGSIANKILVKTDSPLTREALKLANSELEVFNGKEFNFNKNKLTTTKFKIIIFDKKVIKVRLKKFFNQPYKKLNNYKIVTINKKKYIIFTQKQLTKSIIKLIKNVLRKSRKQEILKNFDVKEKNGKITQIKVKSSNQPYTKIYNNSKDKSNSTKTEEKKKNNILIIILIIVFVVAPIIIFFLLKKKNIL